MNDNVFNVKMLSQTPSKPRGRPPGSRNKKPRDFSQTPKPYTPKSYNTNKFILSDEQIRINLGRPEGEPSTDKRIGGASRTIFKITGQYPWKWAAGFPPRYWTVDIVRNLRQLIKGFNDKTPNSRDNNCQEVKHWLRDKASKRDKRAPRLTEDDLQDALKYYNIEIKTRVKMSQKITQTGPFTSAAEMVDSNYHVDEESDTESSLFIEDDYDERIAADYNQNNKSIIPLMSSNEATLQPQKRSGPSLECSQAHKRARIFDPKDTGHIQTDTAMSEDIAVSQEAPVSRNATTANDTCLSRFVPDTPYRPRDIADLIDGIDHLRSKDENEKEQITRTLTNLRASMRANEACITPSSIVNHTSLNKLRLILKKYKTEREDIQKGKEFFEQHHQDLALGAAFIAKNNRHYETSLRDCDELIKQTQLQIDQELKKTAERTSSIKAQLESDIAETLRLEARELKVVQDLEYFRVISSLVKLGPSGLETLLNNLKYDNVPLPTLVEEVRAVSAI
ncbi:hypothetical protein NW762_013509 [Fusarium torreyae]|uniref:Uncharacterized protein n=1 Tax=Fusarium torreyae TaxID=1237075 RepID=A0A9W8V7E4_9HYPO|nr:hypothetical protein NW762_013509 [Fusarium torreyae]